ncbi:SIR2-like protein [Propionicimonas paludicola]|uniref:SIR2-like protein n=2 Tax=Propionicimonas paludicola TaxID=185243 RepID=A0A2A9CPN1_9ACTN|nr:SIR2-like protein [Propionicimonas paludicola]
MDFLGRIISIHLDRLDVNTPIVLPCVHDDADGFADVLEAVTRHYGGAFRWCGESPTLTHTPPAGPLNEPMARYLESLCSNRGVVVAIAEEGDGLHVTVNGSRELTGSTATLGDVLAMLSSSEMSRELVLLTYSLVDLDELRAALIWDAICLGLQFAPPELKTLVPIASGAVDVPSHCNRQEGAVRLVVRGEEFIERSAPTDLQPRLHNMLDSVDRRVVLFLGAGASASCRIPQGDYLRNLAIAHLTGRPTTSPDLLSGFRDWLEANQRWMAEERDIPAARFERGLTLERVLREEFFALNGRPRSESSTYGRIKSDCEKALERTPAGRRALWELPALLPKLVIATVNFDELIEDGMGAEHRVIVGDAQFSESADLVRARLHGEESCVPVLKIHGTVQEPDSMVANINDTSRGLPRSVEQVLDAITEDGESVLWLWVGCSMRDQDLRQWLAKQQASLLHEYWVDPLPPVSVRHYAQDIRRTQWAALEQDLGHRQITESSDLFLPALAAHARALSSAGL